MKRTLFLVLICCISTLGEPKPASLIANIPGRATHSLNGVWRTIVDPYETGLGMRFYENRKPKNKQELVEYDFDASPTLNVPGDWNMQRPELFFYEGPVWYERTFLYQKHEHMRTFLHFGAANYLARVYLNGTKLGEHEGGFTPFDFEITDAVHEGENFVVVEVNNARRVDAVPSVNTDWWNFGGLTRDVEMVDVPETFIRDYSVQLAKGSTSEITGWVQFDGTRSRNEVTIEIPDANIMYKTLISPDGRAEIAFDVSKLGCTDNRPAKCPKPLQLWSPETPKLYRVVISGEGDRVEEEIGFRTIETRGHQILLNGKPIFLRGVAMHEEAPFRGGRAFSVEDERTLLGWAKELGCNFIRLAHYPHNANTARLADQMGLLLWEEVPVYWGNDWKNPATLEVAEEQMRDLIDRDKNRASVALWSVGNETPIVPDRLEFLKNVAAYARELDSTRLITAAMNERKSGGPDVRVFDDPLGQYLDVLGINEYIGWYDGPPEDCDRMQWKIEYDKPVIISEFGAGAPFGNHGDANARWTEEYQADLYTRQIGMLKRISQLAGMTPWVLMDFHSPRRFLPVIQDFYNRKGLISNRGQRKEAFYVLQKFYWEMANTPQP
ncbi:MAG TPA: glycoside hydrolase family 2 TIM barrel-domain containing protein [Candidatus Limnocylindrales bacterium]|nr:glycoside hydrolase family 2 TIM barrel-domain containing protein [Candidatus Limnocylindrales bacterium]